MLGELVLVDHYQARAGLQSVHTRQENVEGRCRRGERTVFALDLDGRPHHTRVRRDEGRSRRGKSEDNSAKGLHFIELRG